MSQQLVQIQELTGQGQRRLQDLRAQIEAQHEAAVSAATPPSPGDTSKPAVPGPATLYVSSLEQFRRGSYGVARTGFQQLLTQYPKYEAAPLAQEYIGESFSAERNDAAADSVYQVVLTKYPTSSAAPTALYKRAELLQGAGKDQESKALLQRLVHDYPKSDAAGLAREQLGIKK
jgi:tol-pal system protein YbgF